MPLNKVVIYCVAALTVVLMAVSCTEPESRNHTSNYEIQESNGIYYWRTDLHLDSTERAFLQQYNIRKVFEMVYNKQSPQYRAYQSVFELVEDEPEEPTYISMCDDFLQFRKYYRQNRQ